MDTCACELKSCCEEVPAISVPALLIDASVKRLGQLTHMCPKNKSHLLHKTHKQINPALPSVVLVGQWVLISADHIHSFMHRSSPPFSLTIRHSHAAHKALLALLPGGLRSSPTPLHEGIGISSLNPRLGGLSSGEVSEEGLVSPSRAWSFSKEPCRQKQNMPASAFGA